METDPSIEFDHYLAQKLGMMVVELRERMSHAEYVHWSVYYAREAQRRELAERQAGG